MSRRLRPEVARVLGLCAVTDIIAGVGLFLFGMINDTVGIQLAGGVVGLAGLLLGVWLVIAGDRPEQL